MSSRLSPSTRSQLTAAAVRRKRDGSNPENPKLVVGRRHRSSLVARVRAVCGPTVPIPLRDRGASHGAVGPCGLPPHLSADRGRRVVGALAFRQRALAPRPARDRGFDAALPDLLSLRSRRRAGVGSAAVLLQRTLLNLFREPSHVLRDLRGGRDHGERAAAHRADSHCCRPATPPSFAKGHRWASFWLSLNERSAAVELTQGGTRLQSRPISHWSRL